MGNWKIENEVLIKYGRCLKLNRISTNHRIKNTVHVN